MNVLRQRRPGAPCLITICLLGLATAATGSEPAVEDACFIAVRAQAADAERICSDRLAGLRYDGTAELPQRVALAATLNNRAMARMAIGDLEGAATDIDEALSLRPDDWAIHLNRGNFELMRANPSAALEAYDRVAESAPAESPATLAARRNSALAWRALGNLAAAVRSLAQ